MRKEIKNFEGHLTADEDYWNYVYSDDTEWNTKVNGYWDYDEECEEYNSQIEVREDSLIDACYELVLKLHERKLLN